MKGRVPALALLLLAFPLLVNLPAYSTLSAEQTSMPYVLLDALLIVLLQAAFESSVDERHLAYRAARSCSAFRCWARRSLPIRST